MYAGLPPKNNWRLKCLGLRRIIDESKLARLIGNEVLKVSNLNFFGVAKVKVISVAMATGYDNAFNSYLMEDLK
jgi:hypothetical protein